MGSNPVHLDTKWLAYQWANLPLNNSIVFDAMEAFELFQLYFPKEKLARRMMGWDERGDTECKVLRKNLSVNFFLSQTRDGQSISS